MWHLTRLGLIFQPGIAGKLERADAISVFHYLENSENMPFSAIQVFYDMGCPL